MQHEVWTRTAGEETVLAEDCYGIYEEQPDVKYASQEKNHLTDWSVGCSSLCVSQAPRRVLLTALSGLPGLASFASVFRDHAAHKYTFVLFVLSVY